MRAHHTAGVSKTKRQLRFADDGEHLLLADADRVAADEHVVSRLFRLTVAEGCDCDRAERARTCEQPTGSAGAQELERGVTVAAGVAPLLPGRDGDVGGAADALGVGLWPPSTCAGVGSGVVLLALLSSLRTKLMLAL